MKVLVTGGAGFIGSHLCEHLLREKHTVIAVDDLSTGSIFNLNPILENSEFKSSFQLIVSSILDCQQLESFIANVDLIYHLAAGVGVKLIVTDPVQTMSTNIRGTEVVAHLANKWRKPIVFTSTSEVYGKNPNPSFSESDDMVFGPTTHVRWSYACSKAIDEFLLLTYHRKNGLPTTILRLFNTVGPRQTSQYGMVLPTFVRQALRNEPITVYGDGNQSRTFCYVTDVVGALAKAPFETSAMGQVFNVGGKDEITIADLASLVKKKTGTRSEITFVPYEIAYAPGFEDMPKRVPNISKLGRLIGYAPKFGIEEIVDLVIKYFKEHPQFS